MVSTRTNIYDADNGTRIGHRASNLHHLSVFEQRERWVRLLQAQRYQIVLAEVLRTELPKYDGSNILPTSPSHIMRESVMILASAPSVLLAAVDGTLAHRMLTDIAFQQEYALVQERAHAQPSVYIHLLADEQGIAPTANQYLAVRQTVMQYLSLEPENVEIAGLIDNVSAPAVHRSATATGHRKYLWTSRRSPQHVEKLTRFCEGVARRVADVPFAQRDIPLRYPPSECGYSINSPVRLAQHRNRQSSNYVMNLVEDVCGHLHRTGCFTQRFHMHPFIVSLLFRPQQAAIAEIVLSGLLQVWVEEGGGLNAYPAGRSVASARRVSDVQWAEHERWVRKNTDLEKNMRVLKERLEEDVLGLDREAQDVWRDALRSGSEGG